ncbi:type VI secretion system-associated protein TagF [Kosakonia sp. HypNH10]|uniref:type VI secretion system-associated protein TagF n=1 Tax=Kosakonia TaxID=1330547 RepID=UPI000F60BFC5|nr:MULTISPECIES: type VI secretion system-associated protein TagF [Kosakonia]AZI87333.1 type VI secretion system-associated protein TagF [Kosakonia sp. CCTCC M2018092]MDF7760266.1 type VI secretion system-associated protein TagF [Kosakonia cowanii]MDH2912893.1 type VI secretion system-associated protein TagF [Kosakonia sp. HypNH10]
MTTTSAISWYGKLPSAGDFLQRRFPDALQRQWSHWFQVGLMNWQKEEQRGSERQFSNAPIWNFVVPPMLGGQQVQMGCLLPGRDSVGRQYPLCALMAINPLEWSPRHLAQAGDWYQQLGRTMLHAVRNGYSPEQLDQALLAIPPVQLAEPEARSEILDVIGYEGDGESSIGWQQAAECFDPQRQISFWWTNRSDGYPLYTHVHSGNFTGQLFTLLFEPAGGARPGRHGLYPPMFDE